MALIVLLVVLSIRQYRKAEAQKHIYTGTIEAEESYVGSKVGGRVAAVLVREGDAVRAGRRLIVFESDELQAQLKAAEAAQQQASARLSDLKAGARTEEIQAAAADVDRASAQLAKLRSGNRPEEIEASRAVLEQARRKLDLLEAGPRKEDIQQVRAGYEAAQADRRLAEQSLKRTRELHDQGAVAGQTLDEAVAKSKVAAAQVESAKKRLEELMAGTRTEEIEAAREAVKQAEAQYELAKKGARSEDINAASAVVKQAQARLAELRAGARPHQIDEAESALKQAAAALEQARTEADEAAVYAPRNGQLQTLHVQPGDIVAPGQAVAVILDTDRLYMKIYVAEGGLGDLKVGDTLSVVTDSGVRVDGTVEQIPAQAEFSPRNVQTKDERALQVYAVKISLPNPEGKLRAGMSADVDYDSRANHEKSR